jgi:acylglycerol lipase
MLVRETQWGQQSFDRVIVGDIRRKGDLAGVTAADERRLVNGTGKSRFREASDGEKLHYVTWVPATGKPSAVLLFLHGIASHAGWFAETAADLKEQGIAVYAMDRRGSGLSGGRRGHLSRFSRALDDIDDVGAAVRSEQEGVPLFLAASSWAAKLAIVYAWLRPAGLSGLLLLGPGLLPRVNLSTARRLAVLVGQVVAPKAHIAIPLTPALYTTTPHYLEFIRSDPLRLLTATTRFFWETGRLDRRRGRASANLDLPLLVLQGEADAMMDVPQTRAWFSQLDIEDKAYIAYPRAGHTLDFEPDRSRYVADILAWLAAHVSPRIQASADGE